MRSNIDQNNHIVVYLKFQRDAVKHINRRRMYPINDEIEAKDDADSTLTIAMFSDIFVLCRDVVLKIESLVFQIFQYKQAEKS